MDAVVSDLMSLFRERIAALTHTGDTVSKDELGPNTLFCSFGMNLAMVLSPPMGGVSLKDSGYGAVYGVVFGLLSLDLIWRLGILERSTATEHITFLAATLAPPLQVYNLASLVLDNSRRPLSTPPTALLIPDRPPPPPHEPPVRQLSSRYPTLALIPGSEAMEAQVTDDEEDVHRAGQVVDTSKVEIKRPSLPLHHEQTKPVSVKGGLDIPSARTSHRFRQPPSSHLKSYSEEKARPSSPIRIQPGRAESLAVALKSQKAWEKLTAETNAKIAQYNQSFRDWNRDGDALESRVAALEAQLSESLSDAVNSLNTETSERKRLEEVCDRWQSKSEEQDRAIQDLQTHISKQTAGRAGAHREPPVESFRYLDTRAQPPYPQPQEEGYDIARDLNDYHWRQPTPASRSRVAQRPASARTSTADERPLGGDQSLKVREPREFKGERDDYPQYRQQLVHFMKANASVWRNQGPGISLTLLADADKVWRSAAEALESFDKVYAERHRDKSAEIEYESSPSSNDQPILPIAECLPGVTVATYMAAKPVGASDLVRMVEFFVSGGDRKLHMLTRNDRLTNTLSKHVFQPRLATNIHLPENVLIHDFTQKLDERQWRNVNGCEPDSDDDLIDYYEKKERKILTSGWPPTIKDAKVKVDLQARNSCFDCGKGGCRPGRPECKLTKHDENVSAVQEDDGTSDSGQSHVPDSETESDYASSDESTNAMVSLKTTPPVRRFPLWSLTLEKVDHIVLDCTVGTRYPGAPQAIKVPLTQPIEPSRTITSTAVIDTSATTCFVYKRFVKNQQGLESFMTRLPKPRAASMADESRSRISHSIELDLVIGQHSEPIVFTCRTPIELSHDPSYGLVTEAQRDPRLASTITYFLSHSL
ncbi:hypothetical protein AYO21_09514 [Fonsecaea monophora]|uniref:Uncharacterized protein n=1 Tax=Fonsecaea monophora TaxID=254056 RepID=A0A177EZ01_9EURO|nr:hypothetical protein AYO21_09514 [Fonsecaea monophora]OAG36272.1 hypothetical protein AYO21_09514 [Fonsecaea monophora]